MKKALLALLLTQSLALVGMDDTSSFQTYPLRMAPEAFCEQADAFAWRPQGDIVAIRSCQAIKLWSTCDGTLLCRLPSDGGHEIIWSPDGKYLADCANARQTQLWCADGTLAYTLGDDPERDEMGNIRGKTVAFSPDSQFIITAYQNGNSTIWRTADGAFCHLLHGTAGYPVAWSPDSTMIATTGKSRSLQEDWGGQCHLPGNCIVMIWRAQDGELLHTLAESKNDRHYDRIIEFFWGNDSRTLISHSRDQTAKMWDAATGQLVQTIGGNFGKCLGENAELHVGGINPQMLPTVPEQGPFNLRKAHASGLIYSVALNPQGDMLGVLADDGVLSLWRMADGKLVRTLDAGARKFCWNSDGTIIATWRWRNKKIQFWHVADGKRLGNGLLVENTPIGYPHKGSLGSHYDNVSAHWSPRPGDNTLVTIAHNNAVAIQRPAPQDVLEAVRNLFG